MGAKLKIIVSFLVLIIVMMGLVYYSIIQYRKISSLIKNVNNEKSLVLDLSDSLNKAKSSLKSCANYGEILSDSINSLWDNIYALPGMYKLIDDCRASKRCGRTYPHYKGSKSGYDIYYQNAEVKIEIVESPDSTADKRLSIKFGLPQEFEWGNWMSIRKNFPHTLDLSKFKGICFDLETDINDVELRITIADMNAFGDEMWWYDLGPWDFHNGKVKIPFENFYRSSGEGTRSNDYRLDLRRICAYEINILTLEGDEEGEVIIDNVGAYKM